VRKLLRSSGANTFLKFCVVGLSGVLVNEGLLWVLTAVVGLPYQISAIFAIEVSILSNFTFNELWTFKGRTGGRFPKRMLKFNLACAIGSAANYVVLLALTRFANLHYLLSNLVGIAFGTLWNFFLSTTWVWRHDKT